jgi:Arc/MetJ-type ribon-helix-helix transcriptional regulator
MDIGAQCAALFMPEWLPKLMATLTITLPEPLLKFLERKLAGSGYRDGSEYLQALLEAELHEEERLSAWDDLRQKVDEGLASGPPIPATDEFWRDFRAELAAHRSTDPKPSR